MLVNAIRSDLHHTIVEGGLRVNNVAEAEKLALLNKSIVDATANAGGLKEYMESR